MSESCGVVVLSRKRRRLRWGYNCCAGGERKNDVVNGSRRLGRSPALEPDRLERAGVGPQLPCCLVRHVGGVKTGARGASDRGQAGVRGRGREGGPGGGSSHGGGAAEVESGREIELGVGRCRLGERPLVRRGRECWRAGSGAWCRRGLLVVGQAARFGAVGGAVGLLVASKAELVSPIERHGDCVGWWVRGRVWHEGSGERRLTMDGKQQQ